MSPKGLNNESLELVREALASGEGFSATTCADATGMARPIVRRYFEYLVETREIRVRPKYGGGRPERLYQAVH